MTLVSVPEVRAPVGPYHFSRGFSAWGDSAGCTEDMDGEGSMVAWESPERTAWPVCCACPLQFLLTSPGKQLITVHTPGPVTTWEMSGLDEFQPPASSLAQSWLARQPLVQRVRGQRTPFRPLSVALPFKYIF